MILIYEKSYESSKLAFELSTVKKLLSKHNIMYSYLDLDLTSDNVISTFKIPTLPSILVYDPSL